MIIQHNLGLTQITSSVRNVVLFACIFFFAPAFSALAATYTWDGGGGTNNWSECANWSSNTCPTSADIAQFNSTSVKDATVDGSFGGTVLGVAVNAGYTGVITQARNLTIGSSNFTMASGTWAADTTTFDLNGSFTQTGGTFFAAAGTSTIQGNMTLSGGALTASSTRVFQFDDSSTSQSSTLTCTGDFQPRLSLNKDSNGNAFTLAAGCVATTTDTIILSTNFANTLTVNGTLNITRTGSTTIAEVIIGASGTLTIQADLIVNSGFTLTSGGTFNHNNYIVQFYDPTTNNGGTLTCTGAFPTLIQLNKNDNGSDFTVAAGCSATTTGTVVLSANIANTLTVNGVLSISQTATTTISGDVVIGASGTLTINADIIVNTGFTLTSGGTFNHNNYRVQFYDTATSQGGTLTCTGAFPGPIQLNKDSNGSDFTIAAGCVATTTGAVVLAGGNATDLFVNGTLVIPNTSTTTVTGATTIGASGTLTIQADLIVNSGFTLTSGGIFNHNNKIVQFYDTGTTQAGTLTCTGAFPTFISIAKDSSDSDFTIAAGCAATTTGTVVLAGGNITDLVVNGTLAIAQVATTTIAGGVTVGASGTLALSADIAVVANFTLTSGGTFNHNNKIVQFYDTGTTQASTLTCTGAFPTFISIAKDSAASDFTIAAGCAATTTGTVVLSVGNTTDLVVNGTLAIAQVATTTIAGGVTVGASGTLALSADIAVVANFTLTSGGTLNHNGYIVSLYDTGSTQASTLTCTGAFPTFIQPNKDSNASDFTIVAGCAATTTGAVTLSGGAATDLFVNGALTITQTSTTTITGSVSVGSAGTLALSGNLVVYIDLTVTSGGSVVPNGSTVQFYSPPGTAYDSILTCTGDFPANIWLEELDGNADFAISSGCRATSTFPARVYKDITVNGILALTNTAEIRGAMIINGTSTYTGSIMSVWGNFTLASNATFSSATTVQMYSPGGTGYDTTLTCTGDFPASIWLEKLDGNADFAISSDCRATSTFPALVYKDVTVNGTLALTNTAEIRGAMIINGTSTYTGSIMSVWGNFTLASNATFSSATTVQMYSPNGIGYDTTLSCTGAFTAPIWLLKIDGNADFTLASGCTATSTSVFVAREFTIAGSLSFTESPSTVATAVVSGRLALNGYNFSPTTFSLTGTLARIGNETITAPTLGDSSLIEYTGTSTYTTLGATTDFESIAFTGGGQYVISDSITVEDNFTSTASSSFVMSSGASITLDGGNQTITGTSTFNSLTKVVTATSTLTFGAGQEQTLNGVTTLTGTPAAPLLLRSTATGTQYRLMFNGVYEVEYVSLRDALNPGSTAVICYPGCTDVANNTNFSFVGDPLAGLRRWDGGGANTLWSTAANWEFDQVPSPSETVVFSTTSVKNSTIDAAFGTFIGGIIMAPGYTGAISASTSLTITSAGLSVASGTFVAPSSTFAVRGGFTQVGGVFVAPAGVLFLERSNLDQSGGVFDANNGNLSLVGSTTIAASAALNDVEFGTAYTQEPLAHWRFDELTASETVANAASTSATGTPNGTSGTNNLPQPSTDTATTVTFYNPYSKDFDGTDDTVTASGIDVANRSFTVMAWAKRRNTGGWEIIFGQGVSSGGSGLHVGFDVNRFVCNFWGYALATPGTYTDTEWNHWACTYDADTNTRTIYRNGVSVTSNTPVDYTGTGTFTIGSSPLIGGSNFEGKLDDVRVYDTALASTTIASIYASGESGYGGALLVATSTLTASGDLTIGSGSLVDLGTSTCSGGSCSLSIGGNYTNNGTFLARLGTTTLSGVAAQTATGTLSGTSSFHHLQVTNTTGEVTFGAALDVDGTFTMGPDTSAVFLANATHTVERIDWDGESTASRITLSSTEPGTEWVLLPNQIATSSYVHVSDSRNASTSVIRCVDGCADGGGNTNWDFPLSAGFLALNSHPEGQPENQFTFQNKDDVPFFRFALAPDTEGGVVDDVVLSLRGVRNIDGTKVTDLRLYRDSNSDGVLDGGDTQVLGAGVMAISEQSGTVTFSSGTTSVSTTTNFIVTGDTVAIKNGDMATWALVEGNVTAVGASTSLPMLTAGTVPTVQHIRTGNASDGGSGQTGGDAPAGVVRSGGVQGGGSGDLEAGQGTDGANIAPDPDFFRPTTNGSPHNEWTGGANAYQSDGTYATAASANLRQTYGGFGFAIPSSNTIQGIQVKLDGSGTTAAGTIQVGLSWDGGNTITTLEATPTLSGSDVVYTLGGQSNLWGRSWTATELNDTNFRLRIVAQPSSNTVRLDAVEVRVYHTAGGGGQGGVGEQEL